MKKYILTVIGLWLAIWIGGMIFTNARASVDSVLKYYKDAPIINTFYCQGELTVVVLADPDGTPIWRGQPNEEFDPVVSMSRLKEILMEQYDLEPYEAIHMMPDVACEAENT